MNENFKKTEQNEIIYKDKDFELKTFIQLYINSFTEKELCGFAIAKKHLGFSFQIEKSVGFQKWKIV